MTGALGAAQVGIQSSQNGIQSQLASPNDPLTLHLAKMSRSQLNEIMSEMKVCISENFTFLFWISLIASEFLDYWYIYCLIWWQLMATQNKEQARQLLLTKPQLLKALFQVFIYCLPLGIVVFLWHFLSVPCVHYAHVPIYVCGFYFRLLYIFAWWAFCS